MSKEDIWLRVTFNEWLDSPEVVDSYLWQGDPVNAAEAAWDFQEKRVQEFARRARQPDCKWEKFPGGGWWNDEHLLNPDSLDKYCACCGGWIIKCDEEGNPLDFFGNSAPPKP